MRALILALLAIAMCGGLLAQAPQPGGRFYGTMVFPGSPNPSYRRLPRPAAKLLPRPTVASAPPAKVCSVAMPQMPISKNVDRLMPKLELPLDRIASMPVARVPAPPCK